MRNPATTRQMLEARRLLLACANRPPLLPERSRRVISLRAEGLTLEQIADTLYADGYGDGFRYTRERIRQIANDAMSLLRHRVELDTPAGFYRRERFGR